MSGCPDYEAPGATQGGSQILNGGSTGPYDCMAWAASRVIAMTTCGAKVPTGRTIRLQSSEPIPDPDSPGLNISQVAKVARERYGVYLDQHASSLRQVSWAEYEERRMEGQPCLIAIGYEPIAGSQFDAGRGFRANHALAENRLQTYDPLADGRAPGVWRYDGRVYPRSLIRDAAGELVISPGRTVRDGYVWCAFGRDVVPDYQARVPAGDVLLYRVQGGVITDRWEESTGGFSAKVTAPMSYPDGAGLPGDSYYLSMITTKLDGTPSSRRGDYLSASKYVTEA